MGQSPWGRKELGTTEATEQAYKVTQLACGRAGNGVSRILNTVP